MLLGWQYAMIAMSVSEILIAVALLADMLKLFFRRNKMNHTHKAIPGFQFKIRFNSTFNCWEVWTYRAGETDPRTAKWMKVSKETAHWYQEAKTPL